MEEVDEDNEPETRDVLPFFSDPKVKISIWTIIKDSVGKDITKMSVPVYFNDPHSILQKQAATLEYVDLVEKASLEKNVNKRTALIGAFLISCCAGLEKSNKKPFNPLLGETYEMKNDKYEYLAEQVSHHPPITAWHLKGYTGYEIWSCNRVTNKFTGKCLNFIQVYNLYVKLLPFNELY